MPIRVRALLFAVLACLAFAAGGADARAERRVALVIGNSAYRNPALAAPTARADAQDVAQSLKALGFEVVLETDADLSASGKAIQQFARLAAGADAALFYYAGHAVQHHGRNFLLPVDADVNDEVSLAYGAVALDGVRGVLERAPGVRIMALDAARANPVSERLLRRGGGAPAPAQPERPPAERLLVAYAAAPGAVADDGGGRNSPYAGALLKRLAEPGLEVETLFRRVAGDVVAATGGRQRPQTYVSPIAPFVLNDADRAAWDKVRDSDDPAALRDFMERFPSSFHAIEARYRLKALEAALRAQKERALREAEDARRAKEAAAQEAARRAQLEATCRGESAALNEAQDADALRRLAGGACPQVVAVAKTRLAELEARLAAEREACRRDEAALAALGAQDADGIRALAKAGACAAVKSAAGARLAALEAEAARRVELCRREDAETRALAQRGDGAGLEALRGRAQCEATATQVASALAAVAAQAERARQAALQAACERDGAALAGIGDGDAAALKAFLAKAPCAPAAQAAQTRLAGIEAAQAREAAACRAEDEEMKKLAGEAAGLSELRGRARCPATVAALDRRLGEIAAQQAAKDADRDAACRREAASLEALAPRDLDALRAFAGRVDCAEVKTLAAQKIAALEEAARQEALASARRQADACRREEARLAELSGPGDPAALEALATGGDCASVAAAAGRRLAEVRTACRADAATLAALPAHEAAGLRALAETSGCAAVRTQAGERLAALEADAAREAAACAREADGWRTLETRGARAQVEAFRAGAQCPALQSAAERRLADLSALCRSDEAALAAIGARDAAALRAFASAPGCPEARTRAGERLAALEADAAREAAACAREEAALSSSGEAGLRALAQSASCASVKSAAGVKVAALEAQAARLEEDCRREDLALASLKSQGAAARDKLEALKGGLVCARLAPQIEAALRDLPPAAPVNARAQIRAAQTELARLGCLAPTSSGALDARTKAGFSRYFETRGAPQEGALQVTDEFVARLKAEPAGLCPPASVAAPARPAAPKKEIVRLPVEDEPRPRPEPKREKPLRDKGARPVPDRSAPERATREKPAREARPAPAAPPPAAASQAARRPSSSSPIGVGF